MMKKRYKLFLAHSLLCGFFTNVFFLYLACFQHEQNAGASFLQPSNHKLLCCLAVVVLFFPSIISQLEPECHHLANLLHLTHNCSSRGKCGEAAQI